MFINSINPINSKCSTAVAASRFPAYKKVQGKSSSYYEIKPQTALDWDFDTAYKALENLIGKRQTQEIFNGKQIASPHSKELNSEWLKQSKIIGINPRAIGTYFDIVKYAMTFPEDSIHLLPLFESGCLNSLYAPLNFKLSKEFMDDDLSKIGFNTPEKQLKLVINILHALNKSVGMDFLQHTDRFSQEVFINPNNFIWTKIDLEKGEEQEYPDVEPDRIGEDVKDKVIEFLRNNGNAKGEKIPEATLQKLYSLKEDKIRELLFGNSSTEEQERRRVELMNYIRSFGFETKPISIDDPQRKIVFKNINIDKYTTWAGFTDNLDNRIFGSLTGYKLYHLDENGYVDTSRPNYSAWEFICRKNLEFQSEYNFDFLRADMGYLHYSNDKKNDIHSCVKHYIQQHGAPYFASLGESFSGYSDIKNEALRRKSYDAILGNLHYEEVYNPNYNFIVKRYNFAPDYKICVTSLTADADQAKYNNYFDDFQNKIRVFYGLFLNQPSYMGMGLETRDANPTESAKLTKDFINNWGNKFYEWGQNDHFFNIISGMRYAFAKISDKLKSQLHFWLNTGDKKVASWLYYDKKSSIPSFIFVANADTNNKDEVEVQNPFDTPMAEEFGREKNSLAVKKVYSSKDCNCEEGQIIIKGKKYKIRNLAAGECRIYKVINPEIIEKKQIGNL